VGSAGGGAPLDLGDAAVRVHEDVVAWPLGPGRDVEFSGGLLDGRTHRLVPDAVQHDADGGYQEQPAGVEDLVASRPLPRVRQDVLYGGILYNHFGHFLFESLGRLWAYEHVRHLDPVIFFYAPGGLPKYLERGNYVHQALAGFDIPIDRLATSTETVVMDRVLVPAQRYGYGDGHWKHPPEEWLSFVRRFRFPQRPPRGLRDARRVYVSRSRMPGHTGRPMAERMFEDHLRSNGYQVFHPQDHTLYEQLSVYSRAEQLVFCDGGALHGCILLPDLTADVAVVSRRRDVRWDCSEIVDQFTGYGQPVLWVDHVASQYQFGLETWNARTLVDWYDVSIELADAGFLERPFAEFRDVDRQALVHTEIADYARAVGQEPAFLAFLAQQSEPV
jgi:hypothetical protein